MLLWDRPNCGASDVQFYGQSESHMRAETLHAADHGLGIGPCILAGGSGGARDSMLTTMLYPEIVTKLVVWNIVGGVYGSFVLGVLLHHAEHPRGARTGMEGVLHVAEWSERIEENPANKQRFLDLDADEFLKVMLRWLNAFVSKPGQTIPGVPDEMFDDITVPTLIIRGGENDRDHPKRTSLEVSCLIKGSKLIDPPWPEDAWERASEERAAGKVQALQHVRHVGAGRAPDPGVPGRVMMRLHRCECGPRSSARPPARCGLGSPEPARGRLAQRHMDDVPAVVAGHARDLAGEPESGQHAVRVVVGSPADVGEHARAAAGRRKPWCTTSTALCFSSSASSPAISNSTSRRPAGIAARSFSITSAPASAASRGARHAVA